MTRNYILSNVFKSQKFQVKWNLREAHKITERRGGAVYKTRSLGLIVCLPDYQLLNSDAVIGSVSTSVTSQLYSK